MGKNVPLLWKKGCGRRRCSVRAPYMISYQSTLFTWRCMYQQEQEWQLPSVRFALI